MHIIILGALLGLVAIIAIFFIKRIMEVILTFLLYIVVIGLGSSALISYIISKLFELEFWIIFPITLIISVLIISIITDRYQPESKKNSKKVEGGSSMGLLSSAKNIVNSDPVKSAVKDVIKETVKNSESVSNIKTAAKDALKETTKNVISSDEVKSALKQTIKDNIKNPLKKSEKDIADISDINRMNAIRFNSAHLTDEQLIDYVKNKSIELYEKMGYAAAFADRYPPEK